MPVSFLKNFTKCGASVKPNSSETSFIMSLFSASSFFAFKIIPSFMIFLGLNP